MLVLTRKYQEKIRIGDNITITVLRTKGKAVRLGIEAPADVPVLRGELSFETTEDFSDATSDASTTAAESAPTQRVGLRRSNSWASDSPQQASVPTRDTQRTRVELKRVPRGEVASFMPRLVAGQGPLRAMMDQR
jgi:carbon storage regulator CsrA